MKNINRYLWLVALLHLVCMILLFLCVVYAQLLIGDVLVGFVCILSILQVITGLRVSLIQKQYPEWFRGEMNFYWIALLGFFIVLFAMVHFLTIYGVLNSTWLLAIPYMIGIYQFRLMNGYNNELLSSHNDMAEENLD